MTTATTTNQFTRAIHVHRSDEGTYEFATTYADFFEDVTSYRGTQFEWHIIEPLRGWGDWTHAIRVIYGDSTCCYFVR